jgi:4-hydroxythreonine-4-phosphate dehydrogenase
MNIMDQSIYQRPLLAITMGDPAGIGPEIIIKALKHKDIFDRCRPFVVGDHRIFERAFRFSGVGELPFEMIESPQSGQFHSGTLPLFNLSCADPEECKLGVVSIAAGKAAVECVFKSCDLAMEKAVDAVVTTPLNKAAMNSAGYAFAGHTEIFKERTHAQKVTMMLTGGAMRVVHVSTHVSLQEAIARVKRARVEEVIQLAFDACRSLGISEPRIAVAGLNPHAGEGGLFGTEEKTEIQPAIEACRAKGWIVSGPVPPDTVFLRAMKGEFDIVVAMYHDQGHIPMKLMAFDTGVNVSLGMPIIRTSVDHGTAFDIAGSGKAREDSLIAAIDVAIQLAVNKM